MEDRTYEVSEKGIGQHIKLDSGRISFFAENVRREKTGLHATLYIIYRSVIEGKPKVIGYDTLNVQRYKSRWDLCRESYKMVGDILKASYSAIELNHDLSTFCMGLENALLMHSNAEDLDGTEDPVAPGFILKPYVIESAGTILFAPPGRGKSYISILMAILIDSGHNGFWPVNQKKVLFINLERARQSIKDRIGMINRQLDLPPTRPLLTLNARGKSLVDIAPKCRYAIEKHKVEVIFLDSISRAGFGALNEDKTANSIIDTLSSLCQCWIAIAHTSKADDSQIFGSQMFNAGIDMGIQMMTQAEDDKLGVGLRLAKNNWGRMTKEADVIAFKFGEYVVTDIRKGEPGEFSEIEASRNMGMVEQILEYLRDCHLRRASATDIAKDLQLQRTNVSKLLKDKRHFSYIGRSEDKSDKKIYYGIKESHHDDSGGRYE